MNSNVHYRNTCLLSTGFVETKYTLRNLGVKTTDRWQLPAHYLCRNPCLVLFSPVFLLDP